LGKAVKPKAPGRNRRSLFFINVLLILIPLTFFGYRPFLRAAGNVLVVQDVPQAADAIVVLAGGEPGRALKAAELYQRHLAPVVVITTEPPPAIYEEARKHGVELVPSYENYFRMLVGYGVPANNIVRIEPYVYDTLDELTHVADLARQRNWKRILVVTSNFHTRRSKMVCRYVFAPGITFSVIGSNYDSFDPDNWWTTQARVRTFAIEAEKLVTYSAYLEPRLVWRAIRS
jgi:uncharacterized SAM-binding protein YcdF (DUF218 family)